MNVSLEPLKGRGFVLRVHPTPDGDWRKKSPYTWSCTVEIDEGGSAELKGITRVPSAAELAAIKAFFRKRKDVHTVWWQRANGSVFQTYV